MRMTRRLSLNNRPIIIGVVMTGTVLENLDDDLLGDMMNNAHVLWKNELDGATFEASNDAGNIPNLYDNMTTSFWRAGTSSTSLKVNFAIPTLINCAGIAAGNWAETACTISVYDDAGTLLGELNGLKDNEPHMFVFEPKITSYLRFEFDISASELFIGQIGAGKSLNFPRNPTLGLELGKFNNNDKMTSSVTEGNAFGATSFQKRSRENKVPFKHVPMEWVRSDWVEFSDNHKGKLVWMAWDAEQYPEDTMFGHWSSSKVAYSSSLFTDITFKVEGHVR